MRRFVGLASVAALMAVGVSEASAASLRGSPASMVEQNQVAKDHGLAFYRTAAEIHAAVAAGELVELKGNDAYEVADFVRYPFLQPAALVFVERLSEQYRSACGQKLVVTSAVRPTSGQPANSHRLSVHPTGIAIDLRVSDRASCRSWLEGALLGLERRGVLNGIREFRPPHYHVALYPEPYMAYVEERVAEEAERLAAAAVPAEAHVLPPAAATVASGFVATESQAAPGETGSTARLAAVIALLLAAPFGLRLAGVRWRRR